MAGERKRLRAIADHLYEIAEDGYEKTAAEIEAEMCEYLKGELLPLLEAAREWAQAIHVGCFHQWGRFEDCPNSKCVERRKVLEPWLTTK